MHVYASTTASEAHPVVWSLSLKLLDTHLHSLWVPFSVFLNCEVIISSSVPRLYVLLSWPWSLVFSVYMWCI